MTKHERETEPHQLQFFFMLRFIFTTRISKIFNKNSEASESSKKLDKAHFHTYICAKPTPLSFLARWNIYS